MSEDAPASVRRSAWEQLKIDQRERRKRISRENEQRAEERESEQESLRRRTRVYASPTADDIEPNEETHVGIPVTWRP
ncbi:hypothetical protein ABGN05_25000 [Aquibium sp. LZ166]|uniref:IBB domain-containing protein n=1 Tax=Aquibium pacificus TaxID=3153579 RepID=A0ABV3SQ31_9HYPH